MSVEQTPGSPEQQPYEPTFDLERLSAEQIVALHASLDERSATESSTAEPGAQLKLALCADLLHLTERNLDKARDVFHTLAHSDHLVTRRDTAALFGSYLTAEAVRAEREKNYRPDLEEAIRLWVRLTKDDDQDVSLEAADSAGSAIRDGAIPPNIAAWMIEEAVDGRWNWDSRPLAPCKAPWWATDQSPSS